MAVSPLSSLILSTVVVSAGHLPLPSAAAAAATAAWKVARNTAQLDRLCTRRRGDLSLQVGSPAMLLVVSSVEATALAACGCGCLPWWKGRPLLSRLVSHG